MFSALPKLFDRDFVVGYFLPAAAFAAVTLRFNSAYQLFPDLIPKGQSMWQDASLLGILSWLLGVALMSLNTRMIRGMEGYWPFNLHRRLNRLETYRFKSLERKIQDSDNASSQLLMYEMARQFPYEQESILPTSFGNVIRAFETYPLKMYGLDSIGGWFRLLAVTPKDYRELMDSAKAQLDLWVNLFYLSFLVIIEYLAISLYTGQRGALWAALINLIKALWLIVLDSFKPLSFLRMENNSSTILAGLASFARLFWPIMLAILVLGFAYLMARGAAQLWGEWVKSAFDLYLPDLRKKLELPSSKSRKEEREIWESFTLAIYFRDAEALPQKAQKTEAQELLDGLRKLENAELLLAIEAATRLIREDIRQEAKQAGQQEPNDG